MDWLKIKNIIGESVPNCVQIFLTQSGYDTFSSIENISKESIADIEKHLNTCDAIKSLDCCHSEFYKKQKNFKLLPGHRDFLLGISKYKFKVSQKDSIATQSSPLPVILQAMVQTFQQNVNSEKHQARYTDLIRYFSTYVFLLAGRSAYAFLSGNLPLPSIKTILRCIESNKSRLVEGQLRCEELSQYLSSVKTVKTVWLSEDATAIVSKITYDPKTNQLVGLLLPLNNTTGSPIPFSFLAKDADMIKRCIELKKSKNAYVVIAQALDECVPPFILQMFGTTLGSFTAQDVVRRWDLTIAELRKYGIEVVGISSDGDPKLLAAMCVKMCDSPGENVIVTQDIIHLAAKMRNRMLKPSINMPMGQYKVSINHLKSLVKDVQKSIHGLSQMDVCPIDRMNYGSFEKVTHDRVIESLKTYVRSSDATVQYLEISRDITSSYLSLDLTPTERIFKIWHGLFFIRIWRQYIISTTSYTLSDNFITYNAYMCSEINARNIIRLIKKFREENNPKQFLPALFDSQGCEKTFRVFRSMGTTQYTKINFSIYELLHMIGRVEVQHEIAYFKLDNENINFPNKRVGKTTIYDLPSDDEINATIVRAKSEAIKNARKLGMFTFTDIDEFEFKCISITDVDDDDSENNGEEDLHEFIIESDIELIETNQDENSIEDENSPYILVRDENNVKRKIRKSTYIWMLTEPTEKISNDRWKRVRN